MSPAFIFDCYSRMLFKNYLKMSSYNSAFSNFTVQLSKDCRYKGKLLFCNPLDSWVSVILVIGLPR